jgi:hypothetical protein
MVKMLIIISRLFPGIQGGETGGSGRVAIRHQPESPVPEISMEGKYWQHK